jgi:hypothetical protein
VDLIDGHRHATTIQLDVKSIKCHRSRPGSDSRGRRSRRRRVERHRLAVPPVDYSAAVGRSRARHFVATLATAPGAVVYSAKSLSLNAPGVRETRCQDPDMPRSDSLRLELVPAAARGTVQRPAC